MSLTKFPVISEKGNEYRVDLFLDIYGFIRVSLYEEKKTNWLLHKLDIFRFKLVRDGVHHGYYDKEEWGYDFTAMAISTVRKHEKEIEERNKANESALEKAKQFEEWDGIIAEEGE